MKRVAVSSILIAVVLLAVGVTAEAQQPKNIPRIGYLRAEKAPEVDIKGFCQGLREHGYVEGLDGRTQDGSVGLAPDPNHLYSGTKWQLCRVK
jgi:hypothetical protein